MTATITIGEAAARRWDALVVGAGPAGSLIACLLARAGRSVLLVDKQPSPRYKVCGCCLNGRGLATLEALGLGDRVKNLDGVELKRLCISTESNRATLELLRSVAISRAALDSELSRAACDCGAHFLTSTAAYVKQPDDDGWRVELKSGDASGETHAAILICADGLAGRTADAIAPAKIRTGSRMGLGAIAPESTPGFAPGAIHMACGQYGYVGLVRLEDGRLNLGAAVDPHEIKTRGPAGAVAEILRAAKMDSIDVDSLDWQGTPLLSRRRARVAGHRIFALGDCAGYVEPFTGEGMAWALTAAVALAPIALRPWSPDLIDEWEKTFNRVVRRNWSRCSAFAWLLRRPAATRASVGILSVAPALVAPIIRAIQTEVIR